MVIRDINQKFEFSKKNHTQNIRIFIFLSEEDFLN